MAFLSFIVGWLRGGHPERFGVAALLCDFAVTGLAVHTPVGQTAAAVSTFAVTLVVIWLAFRSDRWWPFVAAASLTLSVLVDLLERANSGLSRYAAESAQVGLWIVIYLTLLAGVMERWLAGEPAVSAVALRRRAS
ncbi:hypothetical protein [Brevundimonas sp.]|uniref:hypothetical protein n=1 Tax=Brevundimonas sp. TaxID=1871086 RepID=UPI002BE64880|nr:hypothetical protein [Brevundimonas sp.]HWQ87258.1 hypothetical protein [Brevundimonas sp.]